MSKWICHKLEKKIRSHVGPRRGLPPTLLYKEKFSNPTKGINLIMVKNLVPSLDIAHCVHCWRGLNPIDVYLNMFTGPVFMKSVRVRVYVTPTSCMQRDDVDCTETIKTGARRRRV